MNEKIEQEVKAAVIDKMEQKPATLLLTDSLEQLGLDDLDKIEVVMKLEEAFLIEISDDDADKFLVLNDMVSYIATVL
jgi:acyl carrier protein